MGFVLYYFDGRFRAETARFLFALTGTDYDDRRVDGDGYRGLLETILPAPGLPALEHDGLVAGQSKAIATYLAKVLGHGFYPESPSEQLKVDVIQQFVWDDLMPSYGTSTALFGRPESSYSSDDEILATGTEWARGELRRFLAILAGYQAKFGANGWLVGETMTLADVEAFSALNWLVNRPSRVPSAEVIAAITSVPTIDDLYERMSERLASWLEHRPTTGW